MNKIRLLAMLGLALNLSACASLNSSYYQEPQANAPSALLKVVNRTDLAAELGPFVNKPVYELSLESVDNKPTGLIIGTQLKVTPGPHQIIITCAVSGTPIGQKAFSIRALPGKLYQFILPDSLKYNGYTVQTNVCNYVTLA